jgi:hypothetical protein
MVSVIHSTDRAREARMTISKSVRIATGFAILLTSLFARGQDVLVVGPVDQKSDDSISVLGQSISIAKESSLASIEVGTLVAIEADVRESTAALHLSTIKVSSDLYVAGATDVGLTGAVTKYDAVNGYLTVNNLVVYVVDALVDPTAHFVVGEKIEILGRQPQPGGRLIASQIWREGEVNTFPVRDYLLTGIAAQASGATAGIRPSGQSITGIGANALAIVGTGRSVSAIVGTGYSTNAIVGNGRSQATTRIEANAQAIVGTGRAIQAIVGTGFSTNAVGGAGQGSQVVNTQAIVGTDRGTQAIVGTGFSTSAIVGTGRSTRAIAE